MPELRAVVADPASLTSIHLFQVLAKQAHGWDLPLVSESLEGGEGANIGRLLIGNQAINYRLQHEGRGVSFWDLGEQWIRWSGLPFVYAVWVLRQDLPSLGDVADAFRSVAAEGRKAIPEIVSGQTEFPVEVARRYLCEQIRFECGAPEREGLELFSGELERGGWVRRNRAPLRFI
jgi:chorismate dehydratase